ncbi:MAG TPA: hypothetical protein VFO25_11695 [Candidatus Eremiobacteraceae bacterium]|nr:hypothetical protein [Candidatus Eremiobacteraceae bacterium]
MFRRVIIVSALAAFLSSCAASSVPAPTVLDTTSAAPGSPHARAQSWMDRGAGGAPFTYVSEPECGCVLVYSASRARFIGLISGDFVNPEGITTDSNDALYVTDAVRDANGNFEIDEYAAGSLQRTNLLFAPQQPVDVAVGADGTVYVSTTGAIPAIFVYAKGSQNPMSQLLDPNAVAGWGIAINDKQNIFWGVQTASGYRIDRYPKGVKFPDPLRTPLTDVPESLNFDKQGRIIITQPHVPVVDVFSLQTLLINQLSEIGMPDGAAHDALHNIWVADNANNALEEYFSSDGSLRRMISLPGCCARDVAVFPLP